MADSVFTTTTNAQSPLTAPPAGAMGDEQISAMLRACGIGADDDEDQKEQVAAQESPLPPSGGISRKNSAPCDADADTTGAVSDDAHSSHDSSSATAASSSAVTSRNGLSADAAPFRIPSGASLTDSASVNAAAATMPPAYNVAAAPLTAVSATTTTADRDGAATQQGNHQQQQQQQQGPVRTNVYVAWLPRTFEERDLVGLVAQYGDIASVRLVQDASRSYAFVLYASREAAEAALVGLNATRVNGRRLQARISNAHDGNRPQPAVPHTRQAGSQPRHSIHQPSSTGSMRPASAAGGMLAGGIMMSAASMPFVTLSSGGGQQQQMLPIMQQPFAGMGQPVMYMPQLQQTANNNGAQQQQFVMMPMQQQQQQHAVTPSVFQLSSASAPGAGEEQPVWLQMPTASQQQQQPLW